MRAAWVLGVSFAIAAWSTGWPQGTGDDGFRAVRSFVPASARVFWRGRADVEPTAGKEWVVGYLLAPPGEGLTYDPPYRRLLVLRQEHGVWKKAFEDDYLSRIEVRDLDADGLLEIIVWESDEGMWGFRVLDFREGSFRTSAGLDFGAAYDSLQGFIDMDGDRELELIANGRIPGYLSAMVGNLRLTPEVDRDRPAGDVRIYRFIEGRPVLYFPPPSAVLEGLKRGLVSGYPDTRAAAIEAAGMLRAEALVSRLCALVRGPDQRDAAVSSEALGRIGGPVAVATLVEATGRPALREEAVGALSSTGDPAVVSVLLRWRGQFWARLELARVLGRIRYPQGAQVLCECLRDEDDAVRSAAEESLEGLPPSEVGEALDQVLGDPRDQVRIVAARLLARAGDPRGFQVLMRLVEGGGPYLAGADLQLLGRSGDERAIPLLLSRALVRGGSWGEQAEASGAALGLCELGATEAATVVADDYLERWRAYPRDLPDNLEGYEVTTARLVLIAERFPTPRLVNACLALLQRPEPDVRQTAIRTLGAAKPREAVPSLVAVLRANPEPEVWLAAVEALGKIGGAEALAALREAAAGAEPDIAPRAEWEIIKLRGPETLPLLLRMSHGGDHQATVRLGEFAGEEVEQELVRALREDFPDGSVSLRWGDLQYVHPNDERSRLTEGWFTKVSRRLGQVATPILISRLKDAAPTRQESARKASPAAIEASPCELPRSLQDTNNASAAAMAAAHCLRELGVREAIPALTEAATYGADQDVREVSRWSVVALRRQGVQNPEQLFGQGR